MMLAASSAPLTADEVDALEESSPDAFRSHYAAKIWRYYVSKAVRADLIPEAWSEKLI